LVETKVWPTELGYSRTIRSVMKSREQLNSSVIDIVLLHWPRCYGEWEVDWMDCSTADEDPHGELWLEGWRALERLYAEGFVLAVGVSNFNLGLLDDAFAHTQAVNPMIVQNALTLENMDQEVVYFCQANKIYYQAYGLFRQGFSENVANQVEKAMHKAGWNDMADIRGFIIQSMVASKIGFLVRSQHESHLQENMAHYRAPVIIQQSIFDLFQKSGVLTEATIDEGVEDEL